MEPTLTLHVLSGEFAVCRLDAHAAIPPEVLQEPFFGLTRTAGELSLLVPAASVQPGWQAEGGWRMLQVAGPLDFSLVGILSAIAAPLAQAGISIFACSTYDTDYILVKTASLAHAVTVLQTAGFEVIPAA